MTATERQRRRRAKLAAARNPDQFAAAIAAQLDPLDAVRADLAQEALALIARDIGKRRKRRSRELKERRRWLRNVPRRL
jgi:hypothetical protein